MRRKEFQMEQDEDIRLFLQEMSFGYLATVREDGTPSITPLNYVYLNGAIYFHGSRMGEKMNSLASCSSVSFCVAREYAIIPSYFRDPVLACPATAYFKSVLISGTASTVEDLAEKAEALQAMMVKLQPEGGHKPINASDSDYRGRVKGVAVVRIDPDQINGKFKFGQNLSAEKMTQVAQQLDRRGNPDDAETIQLMRQYCPHHITEQ